MILFQIIIGKTMMKRICEIQMLLKVSLIKDIGKLMILIHLIETITIQAKKNNIKSKTIAKTRDFEEKKKLHGKDYMNRLPPTLRVRETIVFDPERDVPEEIIAFDLAKKNKKKRYETKHRLETEIRDQDVEKQIREEAVTLNRFHGEKYYQEKLKGYDNITLDNTRNEIKICKQYARTEPKKGGIWEQIQNDTDFKDGSSPPMNQEDIDQGIADKFIEKKFDVNTIPLYKRDGLGTLNQANENNNHQHDQSHELIRASDSELRPVNNLIYDSQPIFESLPPTGNNNQENRREGESNIHSKLPMNDADLIRAQQFYSREEPIKSNKSYSQAEISQSRGQYNSRAVSGASNKSKLSFSSKQSNASRRSASNKELPPINNNFVHSSNAYNPPLAV